MNLLKVRLHYLSSGACDVAGGAGSVNSLPALGNARLTPSFDASTPRNVTALVGKSAYLSCRVRNLGNRTTIPSPNWTSHRLTNKRDGNMNQRNVLWVLIQSYFTDERFITVIASITYGCKFSVTAVP
ncbi:unnamed protein product [Colias eurytheme]|nr:unnamed protein product [Colias eurytheme]